MSPADPQDLPGRCGGCPRSHSLKVAPPGHKPASLPSLSPDPPTSHCSGQPEPSCKAWQPGPLPASTAAPAAVPLPVTLHGPAHLTPSWDKKPHLLIGPLAHALPSSVQFSRVQLFATPRTAAHQASLSITNSRSLLKLISTASVMRSSHLILCPSRCSHSSSLIRFCLKCKSPPETVSDSSNPLSGGLLSTFSSGFLLTRPRGRVGPLPTHSPHSPSGHSAQLHVTHFIQLFFFFFGCKACGILVPRPGIAPCVGSTGS